MAKNYREAPLIKPDSESGLPITNERIQKASDLLQRMVALFDEELIMLVATEVGLEECIFYPETEQALSFDLTPLQLVSLGASLAAVAEMREGATKKKPLLKAESKPAKAKKASAIREDREIDW